MALSNFSNHEKNKEKWKNKEILLLWGENKYQSLHVQFKRILMFKTQFHLKRFFSAYISELKKGLFHVKIFRQTGLFKNLSRSNDKFAIICHHLIIKIQMVIMMILIITIHANGVCVKGWLEKKGKYSRKSHE